MSPFYVRTLASRGEALSRCQSRWKTSSWRPNCKERAPNKDRHQIKVLSIKYGKVTNKRREFALNWTSRTSSAASLAASYQLDCPERPLLYTAQKWCSYNSCIIGFWNGSTNTCQKVARVPLPTFVFWNESTHTHQKQTSSLLAGRCRGGWVRYISFFTTHVSSW